MAQIPTCFWKKALARATLCSCGPFNSKYGGVGNAFHLII